MSYTKMGLCFTLGTLFGTAGIRILTSKDAKMAYTHVTAAVLRCRDEVVKTGTILKENCDDIVEDAIRINEDRYEQERKAEIEDAKEILANAEEEA